MICSLCSFLLSPFYITDETQISSFFDSSVMLQLTDLFFLYSFDGDDFDDVEEDEGLGDLENAEEVSI